MPGDPARPTSSSTLTLRLHDSATGQVRPLALRQAGEVSMYVCGPTVYDVPHLGHGRFTLVFDVLRRYLRFVGLRVRYVSNVTDVDDKILERARQEGCPATEVAARYEAVWWEAMAQLAVERPDEVPHATAWVPQMVALVEELVAKGAAYEAPDGVYLDVSRVPDYGLLALQPLASLRAGARVAGGEAKRHPFDFALWKKVPGTQDQVSWPSPFGPGRPGWHTECVVMSLGLLGEGFDLHGGGQDLRFPHHENERAQAVALGRAFARHWVHNGFVEVEGQKMSKSLGNFTSLPDLLAQADPRAYRLLVLRSHYRRPLEVTPATVGDAESGLARLDALARRFPEAVAAGAQVDRASEAIRAGVPAAALEGFCRAMDEDLDTPGALAGIFELVRQAHQAADAGQENEALGLARAVGCLAGALGLALGDHALGPGRTEPDEEAKALLAARDEARQARRFEEADRLRDELAARGWTVEDSPEGSRLRPR
ncbi:cysteine--tRNA ligase [Aciditerrimonas ferrireducens]|uniref:Cysteine--tRNA ligase n=1 Tax=Aciditerrimonas ferrireducens TaxID=667306 RepID=A0ABV6C042_9ACTN|nr:cysteine--tRNA ligase [Aciditerrimonas ferrireducens]MCK4177033.1 cysteine--tRNA ligase [Aciditerrimonas ferrireducens]